jgi:hypothetical protein
MFWGGGEFGNFFDYMIVIGGLAWCEWWFRFTP